MRNIDFNKYQSALIIGNGFDLSLGLSTSYMDFVNSDEFQILLNMQNQLAIYLKVNAELQNWIDIENELKLYSKNEDNAKFKTEYEALCKQLVVYINNIDYSSINKNSKAYEVLTNLSSTKNNIILDFNYTASTRLILKQCGLSDEDIDNRLIKVHGEASGKSSVSCPLKKLDAEYQTLSSEKNGFYTRYKKAQIELRELRTAQQNVEAFFRKEERSHAVPQQEVK